MNKMVLNMVVEMVAKLAAKLAAKLVAKLAAQMVPVIGATTGALTNYAYMNYYREMAHVHFGLRRLSIDGDVPHPELVTMFRDAASPQVQDLRKG